MKADIIKRVKKIYEENGNIMEYLRDSAQRDYNTPEDIMISYDFQAGSYNENYMKNRKLYEDYHCEISQNLNRYIHKIFLGGGKMWNVHDFGSWNWRRYDIWACYEQVRNKTRMCIWI